MLYSSASTQNSIKKITG